MDLGGGREASAPTTSILPPPPRSPGSTPDQYGHTNPPHPASTDLPARKMSKVGKMECEQRENEKCYIHTRSKLPHQTRAHPRIQCNGEKNLQRSKRWENKDEKKKCDILTQDQCVHTNPCTTNQPIHCTALKEDRKENWGPKVKF